MKAKRKTEWFDNEGFWEDMYPFMFPEEVFAHASLQTGKLLTLAEPAGNDVLDLCCGPGRHSIALAGAGFHVTGVDKTKFLLDRARERAAEAEVEVEWVRMDMRDFCRADAFDMIINMWTSFGYFNDKREDLQVLGNIHKSLRPGGVCLIDALGKEWAAGSLPPVSCDALPDGARLIKRNEVFDDWTRLHEEWILIRKDRAKTFKFHHTLYSGQELRDRMQQAGLTGVKLYGNLDGAEYGPRASRLIALGRKA